MLCSGCYYNAYASENAVSEAKSNLEKCREKRRLAEEFFHDLQRREKEIIFNLKVFRKAVEMSHEVARKAVKAGKTQPAELYAEFESAIEKLFK